MESLELGAGELGSWKAGSLELGAGELGAGELASWEVVVTWGLGSCELGAELYTLGLVGSCPQGKLPTHRPWRPLCYVFYQSDWGGPNYLRIQSQKTMWAS